MLKYFQKVAFSLIALISCLNIYANDRVEDENVIEINGIKMMNNMLIIRVKPGISMSDMMTFANNNIAIYKISQLLPDSISLRHKMSNLFNINHDNSRKHEILKAEDKLLRTYILEFANNFNPKSYIYELEKKYSFIEIAEPYYLPEFMIYLPNDSEFGNQVTSLGLVKAFEAWEIQKGSPDIVIGISDSGVNQNHEDLSASISFNEGEIPGDGIDNDGNGFVDDYAGYNYAWESEGTPRDYTANFANSHGQEVTGIAAATTDNSIGIAGVGFNTKFIPIKIIENNRLTHAYTSIIYAALRGCKVLNLSWGSPKPYSDIDQSIIDYAVANDVAIISSAGNIGSGGGTKYSTFYPAGYYGVLGVGESTINDRPDNGTVLGVQTHILAPGSVYTTKNSGYGNTGGGSSFSTPIVSGAVALARAQYPGLSALQTINFIRRCTDPIAVESSPDYLITPGRLNMAKMFDRQPLDIHGIVPISYIFKDINGYETDRFVANDLVKLSVDLRNYLGSAKNVRFVLKEASDPANAVVVNDSIITIESVEAGGDFSIGDLSFMITSNFSGEVIFRLEIFADNEEPDFFKFTFTPYKTISTFKNNKIEFSLSDIGEFGFETSGETPQGSGFKIKGLGNQLYRNSTLMLSEASNRAVYNYGSASLYDFKPIKRFINPDNHISIIDDSFAGMRQIGVQIQQQVYFDDPESNFARIEVVIKNIGASPLLDVSVGYWLDWDIGLNAEKNKTSLFHEIVQSLEGIGAAQIAWSASETDYPMMASGVIGYPPGSFSPQSAGLHYGTTRNFDEFKRIGSLNSGISMQTDTTYDISNVIAMRFDGVLDPNGEQYCRFCIGGGPSETLYEDLMNCLLHGLSVNETNTVSEVSMYPNPASGLVYYKIPNSKQLSTIRVFDILGNEVISLNNHIGVLNIANLPNGVYSIAFSFKDGSLEYQKFIVGSQFR